MKNPFKQILYDEKLPVVIKDKVSENIALIKLTLEVAELFAFEVPSTLTSLIKEDNRGKEK